MDILCCYIVFKKGGSEVRRIILLTLLIVAVIGLFYAQTAGALEPRDPPAKGIERDLVID